MTRRVTAVAVGEVGEEGEPLVEPRWRLGPWVPPSPRQRGVRGVEQGVLGLALRVVA